MLIQWWILLGCVAIICHLCGSDRLKYNDAIDLNVSPTELSALHSFYDATNGDYWNYKVDIVNAGVPWNFSHPDPHPCFPPWKGVSCICSLNLCNVYELRLSTCNLTGFIPSSISNLTQLTNLNLSYNHLIGGIPDSIGNLTHLKFLDLADNFLLGGKIPESIGALKELKIMLLENILLSGAVPEGLYNLTKLEVLQIDENIMTGTISNSVGNLIDLREIHLSENDFHGTLPASIGELLNLSYIHAANNFFVGSIPPTYCNLTKLREFTLSGNLLNSTIPNCMSNMKALTEINLSKNLLTGRIPDSLVEVSAYIFSVYLNNNLLSGPLPPELFNNSYSNVSYLYLNNNKFTGSLPVSNLMKILEIDVSFNYLSGSIQPFHNSTRLTYLSLSNNLFEDAIPNQVGALRYLCTFLLSNNQFTGTLPPVSVSNGTGHCEVNNNQLIGSIPESLCLLKLEYLDLGYNFMTGSIPECIGSTEILAYFTINNNLFSNTLPSTFIDCLSLVAFVISNNLLSGTLPLINSVDLQFYYAQNNDFHGPLPIDSFRSFQYVDVGNNHLSGSLSSFFFDTSSSLKSFAATSNCITGSIPTAICSVSSLEFLDLDGLATAEQCRTPIFPNIPYFTSFILPKQMKGGVPECLFTMNSLQSLHLSGNSLRWSIPTSLVISDSLTQLSLSHNQLTGSIPPVIQNRQWLELVLSYNKLVGNIQSFEEQSSNATLNLEVNRLSGLVPSTLWGMENINILTGNIFNCNFERTNLPFRDAAYKIYKCGSNTFDLASIVWIITITLLSLCGFVMWFCRYYWYRMFVWYMKQFWNNCIVWLSVFSEEDSTYVLMNFKVSILAMQKVINYLTLGIVVVFLLIYAILSRYYKTVEYQYAWTVSVAYLSGATPAVVLLLAYVGFIVALFGVWIQYSSKHIFTPMVAVVRPEKKGNSHTTKESTSMTYMRVTVLFVVVLVNCIIMSVVNGSYVYIVLNYSTEVNFIAQISIALFKLLWNEFAIRDLMKLTRNIDGDKHLKPVDNEEFTSVQHSIKVCQDCNDVHIAQELPCMTFIVLFNTILAPCLATAAVDSNCFYNVFVAATSVSANLPFTNAVAVCSSIFEQQSSSTIISDGFDKFCAIETSVSYQNVKYEPPYIYSYQCSSSILINYASVYVFMFLAVVLKPFILYGIVRVYDQLSKSSFLFVLIDKNLYSLLKPAKIKHLNIGKTLFHKERFVLRTISMFAVFITFGIVFPLLAVVVCIAFFCEFYLYLLMIGRFLSEIVDLKIRKEFRALLSRDCEGCMDLLVVELARVVVPFAALFYSFFVFDIYGDKQGFKRSLWASLLLICTPGFIWLMYKLYLNCNLVKGVEDSNKLDEIHSITLNVMSKNETVDDPAAEKIEVVVDVLHGQREDK